MFRIEVIQQVGKPPITLDASQVVIRMPNGTPVCIAAQYGSHSSLLLSHCNDSSFQADLEKLGISETVFVERLAIK